METLPKRPAVAKFHLDLNAKIIADHTRIFLARAGRQGHLYNQVAALEAIGPDLPMLDLNLSDGLSGDTLLQNKLKRARAYSRWLRTASEKRGVEPPSDLKSYEKEPTKAGHSQIEGIVKGYFQDMAPGDLVVIPNPSYFGDAIIGELLPLTPKNLVKIPGHRRYEGYEFDGRKFTNTKFVKMSDLPMSVIDLARAPTGLAAIGSGVVKDKIFELAYDDYIKDDQFVSRIFTSKNDFTSFDGNVLNALVTMVAENTERIENYGDEAHLLNLVHAAFQQLAHQELQVKIDISSPGYLAIFDRSPVPLVVGAVFAILASVGFDYQAIGQETIIEVGNSMAGEVADACSREVAQKTESMLKLLSSAENEFQRTCHLLREAQENTGAHTKMSVEVER